jgi:hypothetical protein
MQHRFSGVGFWVALKPFSDAVRVNERNGDFSPLMRDLCIVVLRLNMLPRVNDHNRHSNCYHNYLR